MNFKQRYLIVCTNICGQLIVAGAPRTRRSVEEQQKRMKAMRDSKTGEKVFDAVWLCRILGRSKRTSKKGGTR